MSAKRPNETTQATLAAREEVCELLQLPTHLFAWLLALEGTESTATVADRLSEHVNTARAAYRVLEKRGLVRAHLRHSGTAWERTERGDVAVALANEKAAPVPTEEISRWSTEALLAELERLMATFEAYLEPTAIGPGWNLAAIYAPPDLPLFEVLLRRKNGRGVTIVGRGSTRTEALEMAIRLAKTVDGEDRERLERILPRSEP